MPGRLLVPSDLDAVTEKSNVQLLRLPTLKNGRSPCKPATYRHDVMSVETNVRSPRTPTTG